MRDGDDEATKCLKQFGQMVQVVREARQLSQAAVARSLGKSRSVVAFLENGLRDLQLEEAAAWADALGVDSDDLVRLRYLAYGYRWVDGEWTFWSDLVDPVDERHSDGAYDEEVYQGLFDDAAEIVNKLAGKEICRVNGYEDGDARGDGLRLLLPRPEGHETVFLFRPRERCLGDPNEQTVTVTQGTREDLNMLLDKSSAEQIHLTAAFVRGLHAQARSRIRRTDS